MGVRRIAPDPAADSVGGSERHEQGAGFAAGQGVGEHAPTATRAGGFLRRAEVRDVLAWIRLLVDPQDAAAVVRALARPPIELRQVQLARVIQLARRRRLDLVAGLALALESPQVPPEACERIRRFIAIHGEAAAALDSVAPEDMLEALIGLLGARDRPLLADAGRDQGTSLSRLSELASDFVVAQPQSTSRQLAAHLAAIVAGRRSAGAGDARPATAAGGALQMGSTAGDLPAGAAGGDLQAAVALMREEVLESVERIGGRLGELRLDTELDISHGVVRYLELLKLAALRQAPPERDLSEALGDINARLLAAATPLQREVYSTSTLDDMLRASWQGCDPDDLPAAPGGVSGYGSPARGGTIAPREEASFGPFLPRKGSGLALSASDIETYRSCPLRYKFARVLRIPTDQTPQQRFGIVVHQVLERFHSDGAQTLAEMHELLDAGLRRAGFGDSQPERALRDRGREALALYHARLATTRAKPMWFERQFTFRLGPHHLRGRVDRVDLLADSPAEVYELIDYKTSRPKSAAELKDDVQLSLYALAAREAWQLQSSRQAYYYVLDDRKVPLSAPEPDHESIKQIVLEAGEGIMAQRFDPTPSPAACSRCDYRIVCPVADADA